MPATIDYSAVMAIHTLWLAARAEGIGLGWVSILDPAVVACVLDVPKEWTFIGYFCMGYPVENDTVPVWNAPDGKRGAPSIQSFSFDDVSNRTAPKQLIALTILPPGR